MIKRHMTAELRGAAREYPAVTILGPRQSGKTTLARMTFPRKPYFSLEDPDIRMAAETDPRAFLRQAESGAVLDEIQRVPVLLSYLQGMMDQSPKRGRFILTGSHQPELHQAISQSLAGRTAVLTLWPFSIAELHGYPPPIKPYDLIVRGFFPRLHEEGLDPRRFYNSYLQTYVERDLRALIQLRDLSQFQKFLVLLAGRVGQVVNFHSLAGDVGVSGTTLKHWVSVLKASFVLFELPPWFENVGKRVVKSPKLFFTDVGLAAFLLGIHTAEQAFRDPLRGSLYENLVIADVIKGGRNRGLTPEVYFYRDFRGVEVDLLIRERGRLFPVEIKSAETFNPDFAGAIAKFKTAAPGRLAPGTVLYNGEKDFEVHDVRVMNPARVDDIWKVLTA